MRSPLFNFFFLLLVAAVAIPYRVNYDIGFFSTISALDVALLLCTLYLLTRFLFLESFRAGPGLLAAAVLIPVFIAILSLAWASNTNQALTSSIKYGYTSLCYFVALQFGKRLSPAVLAWVLLVIFLGWLAGSAAMYLSVPGFEFFVAERAEATQTEMFDLLASVYTRLGHPFIGQSNDYGALLVLLGFVFLGYARLRKSTLMGVAAVLAFLVSVLTFSRGIAGGLVVGLIAYGILAGVSVRKQALAALSVVLVAVPLWFLAGNFSIDLEDREMRVTDIVESRLSDENIESRMKGYRDSLALIGERPLLGYGAGFHEESSGKSLIAVHNAYLEQWKYFGLILGTLTSLCYLAVILHFYQLRRRAPRIAVLTDAIACGWLALAVSALVQTFFEASVARALIYFVLGLCVCLTPEKPLPRARTHASKALEPRFRPWSPS